MTVQDSDFDLQGRLIDKSVEAYTLALETINRLTIQYRLEAFCYLFCNAWELLLKARLLAANDSDESAIYYRNQGPNKRSLSLHDCLNRIFPDVSNPIRRNIECVEELRDEAVHLVITRIPQDVMGLFQAGVVNYHKCLNRWFGKSLSDGVPVGMMSIVYDLSPEQSDLTDARLRKDLGGDATEFLMRYCAALKTELDQLNGAPEFSIGVEYHVVLTKREDDADIRLYSGSSSGEPTQIVEIPKDPGISHPFRQKEIIEQVNSRIGAQTINQYDVQSVNNTHSIKKRADFFYQGKVPGSPVQYSPMYADWLVTRFQQDDQFFQKARRQFKDVSAKPVRFRSSSGL
ncbi:MAG: DUF3644 domain-containing protein [Chloroflexota bacterium]|nr:DUF3644 domain-containing protein [Chloroflexota bacterium]MDE2959402.1 DUF3644 domain-containing protein [Chloroflexota bacterium]